LPADEVADESLDWLTFPLWAPGLRMFTETAVLLGFVWVDVADDAASWPLPAAWPMPWTPLPPPQQPACWAAFCVVPLVLPADEVADELLDCETFPLLAYGLRMFTETAVLLGFVWVDVADEDADCSLLAS
jgi:hypothetical protein